MMSIKKTIGSALAMLLACQTSGAEAFLATYAFTDEQKARIAKEIQASPDCHGFNCQPTQAQVVAKVAEVTSCKDKFTNFLASCQNPGIDGAGPYALVAANPEMMAAKKEGDARLGGAGERDGVAISDVVNAFEYK